MSRTPSLRLDIFKAPNRKSWVDDMDKRVTACAASQSREVVTVTHWSPHIRSSSGDNDPMGLSSQPDTSSWPKSILSALSMSIDEASVTHSLRTESQHSHTLYSCQHPELRGNQNNPPKQTLDPSDDHSDAAIAGFVSISSAEAWLSHAGAHYSPTRNCRKQTPTCVRHLPHKTRMCRI